MFCFIKFYYIFFKLKRNGVGVINAAATGMGLLTNKGPQRWHPAGEELKSICREAAEHCKVDLKTYCDIELDSLVKQKEAIVSFTN